MQRGCRARPPPCGPARARAPPAAKKSLAASEFPRRRPDALAAYREHGTRGFAHNVVGR